jgi:hypothetical protein
MKRISWTTLLLVLAGAPCTHAQIVTQSRSVFSINFGAGDNLISQFTGPGVNLSDVGGTACSWCGNESFSNTPGTELNPSTQIFYDNGPIGTLTLEGHTTYCQQQCEISVPEISAFQNITFPTNGKSFTVTVPAGMGDVTVSILGDQFQAVNLQIPNGELSLSFGFDPELPGGPPSHYALEQGTFTTPMFPASEPGPRGLMVVALAGLLGLVLRRKLPTLSSSR